MSRLRNRNIRTKIQAVAKWGHNLQALHAHNGGGGGTTTPADSGIAESSTSAPKLNRMRTRRSNWDLDSRNHQSKEFVRASRDSSDDEESRNSCSSVDTMKVLDEIRNLEDSVKSMSAESYNSWTEEYENDATLLVKQEYDRMERVLQCREAIPPHYDKEEYKLWIKTFPLLSLVSRTGRTSENLNDLSANFCDSLTPTPTPMKNGEVLDQLDNLSPYATHSHLVHLSTLPSHSTTTYTNKSLATNNTINPRTLNINSDHSFLQLAPLNITPLHPHRRQFKPSNPSNAKPSREKSNSLSVSSTSGRTTYGFNEQYNQHGFNDIRHFARNNRILYNAQGIRGQNMFGGVGAPERYEKHPRRKSSKTEPLKSSSEFIVLPPIEGKELRSSSAATISSLGKVPTVPLGRLKQPPVFPLCENDKESDHNDHNDGFVSYRHRKRKYK